MKLQSKTLVSTMTLLALLIPNAYAEMAGRVLTAVGDVTAQRGGLSVKLAQGAAVETGDILSTGDTSNVQVRFTDESIVALRPNTSLAVKSYRFDRKPESDSMVLGLVKGGMRTITGLVGKLNRDNYMVESPTATIGIRGTHYTLVSCANDCNNSDGSKAQNGTFGGVTEGRIAVTNNSGQKEFGRDEYFFVASRDSAPQPLLSPPSFLRDRLEGQAKSTGKGKEAPSTQVAETSSQSETEAATAVVATAPVETTSAVTQTAYSPSEQEAVVVNTVNPFMGYTDFGVATAAALPHGAREQSTLDLEGTERLAELERLKLVFPEALTYSLDQGSNSAAGEIRWGRWMGKDDPRSANATDGQYYGIGEHWAVGIPTPDSARPTSGSYLYSHVGGTNPTDNAGNVGTLTSGGSFSIDFTHKMAKSVTPVEWTVGGNMYSLSLVSSYLDNDMAQDVVSVSCGSCTDATGEISGQFTGSSAQGVIVGIHTAASFAGVTQETGQVRAYAGTLDSTTPPPPPNPDPTTPPVSTCSSYPCTTSAGMIMASASSINGTANGDTMGFNVSITADSATSQIPLTPSSIIQMVDGGTVTTGTKTEMGSNAVANLTWGRATYTANYSDNNVPQTETGTGHIMVGDVLSNLPTSGSYTYSHLGGTTPTDDKGTVGVLNDAGSWSVNFTEKTMGTARDVKWTVSGVSYTLNVPNQGWVVTTEGPFVSGGTSITISTMDTTTGLNPVINLGCTPNCVVPTGTDTGNRVSPTFFGNGATALGVGYSTNVQINGVNQVTSHVQAYGR